ncbi:MAG: Y-family DNA polymerase [Bosea sp. (in: a-proteobacteria)]
MTHETYHARRYLCLWLPHLPTDRVRRRERAEGQTAPEPLALVLKLKGALRLDAVDAEAKRCGLHRGQSLADARALKPALRVADADHVADARLIVAVADWTRRYTPLAATDGADGVVLDITGCAHLFGGEASLMADALERLRRQGFTTPRAALAGTPEAAWALARFAPDAARLCKPGHEEAALRPLPVAALGIAPDIMEGLRVAGLTRIEDIWLRPRAPIAARFGRQVIARMEAAFGLTHSAITPRLEAPPYVTERRFFDPILTMEDVTRTIHKLTAEMAKLLQGHGDGARRLEITLFRVDGAVFRIQAGASRPTRDANDMATLFHERLKLGADERDIAFGFDVVRLSVLEAVRLDEAAATLDASAGTEDLARLIDRLGARLGEGAVLGFAALDAHLPEQAAGLVPAVIADSGKFPSPGKFSPCWNPTRAEAEPPDRPLLLFRQPEPIETIASVPDGPPLRFRWRRVLHDVAAVEGPERLTAPWWNMAKAPQAKTPQTRDYFRAEDRQGRRFWLYREGLYRAEGQSPPRWFMHGLFG